MESLHPESLFEIHCQLGEGPLYHPIEHSLYWVDILNQDLYYSTSDLSGYTRTHFQTTIGAFAFRAEGGMVLATGEGFSFWAKGQVNPTVFWNPLPDRAGVRMNDGKVDPAGRFWAGSMDVAEAQGEFYRLDPDGSRQTILQQIGISNGLGWSPDRKTMYYTDSYRATIYAFDYNLETGSISNRRPFVQLHRDEREIVPDGLCVDAEGCIWSAHWNGWQIVRYDPQGKPILTVQVPVQRPTSCCFGGENNDRLFITSSRADFSVDELASQPQAGDVFSLQTDTHGQDTHFFGPSVK